MSTEHKAPKKKDSLSKKKFFKFQTIKKPLVIGGITVAIAIAGIFIGFFIITNQPTERENILVCGIDGAFEGLDPFMIGGLELILVDQVAEGLFDNNQSSKETPLINNLATGGVWSADYLNFICTLRTGVKFHDGTLFNAAAVKWNFDRIHTLMEIMPWYLTWWWKYMYINSEGQPIINRTEVLDTYTVRFVLNKP